MILLGVTGGIGMGKSTSAGILERCGVAVADTDLIAREVVAPGQPALAEIRAAFGNGVFASDDSLDRRRMAEVVFAEADSRSRLESIVHPRIRAEWERRVAEWRAGDLPCAAVVIPLLFETAAETAFDAVLCVACSASSQRRRLEERGWSAEHIRQRVAAQLPIEAKVERSDFLIWTEPPVPVHEEQIRRVLASMGIALASAAGRADEEPVTPKP